MKLLPAQPQGDEIYRVNIKDIPGVRDLAGNILDGDGDGIAGGEFVGLLTLDLQPATVLLRMQPGSDTGASNTDNVTSNNRPVFDITNSEPGTVRFDYDGGGVDIVQAFEGGTHAIPVPVALADGSYTASVVFHAVTPSGSPASDAVNFVIDTAAPAVSNSRFNGVPLSDGARLRGSGTLQVDATDATGVARVEFYLRAGPGSEVLFATDTTPGDGFTAFWDAAPAPDGPYTFVVRALDQFDHMTELTRSFTLDHNVGPVVEGMTFEGATLAEGATVTRPGTLGVRATDADGIGFAEFFFKPPLSVFTTRIGTDSNPGDGLEVLWLAGDLPDGAFDLIARVQDSLGASTEISRRVNLVLAAPPAPPSPRRSTTRRSPPRPSRCAVPPPAAQPSSSTATAQSSSRGSPQRMALSWCQFRWWTERIRFTRNQVTAPAPARSRT